MSDGEDHETANADDRDETVVRRDRFAGGPARSFLSSLSDDERIFAADLAVDRAHVVMLADGRSSTARRPATCWPRWRTWRTQAMTRYPTARTSTRRSRAPSSTRRPGRREDAHRPLAQRRGGDLHPLPPARGRAFGPRRGARPASRWSRRPPNTETVMPGYTHLQPAQPTTVAHFLLSYERALQRDSARLLVPTSASTRRPRVGRLRGDALRRGPRAHRGLLGFDSVAENSMDASATRDFLVETTSAVATLATTLSGLAEDVVVMASKGHVALDDDYASTSSIMPQKRPRHMELVRGRAGDAVAGLTGLLTT